MSGPAKVFCPVCGQPSPNGAVHPYHQQPAASSTPARASGKRQFQNILIGVLVMAIALGVLGALSGGTSGGSGSSGGGAHLTGTFLGWEPVDEGHGYARFSITNSGTETATAKCFIRVQDDFGDFGFDGLVGEEVGPGQTITGRIPIGVGTGSFLINHGEVTDC